MPAIFRSKNHDQTDSCQREFGQPETFTSEIISERCAVSSKCRKITTAISSLPIFIRSPPHPTPENLQSGVKQVLAEYLACGIDPEKATIFIQSDVPEVSELYAFLNMNAYLGELERTTSFKDKARQQPENVNAGLLTYPVLMAADIIIHKAKFVPVGKDQEQNLEMARKFAGRFNRMYNCELFPLPQPFTFDGKDMIKVPGLDGSGKMGKSEGNGIFLYEDPKDIRKKVMRAVT